LAFFTDNILENADNGLITASVFLDFKSIWHRWPCYSVV
jgi:hypothetical protein